MNEKLKSKLSEKAFAEKFVNCASETEAKAMLTKEGFSVTDEEMTAIAAGLQVVASKAAELTPEEEAQLNASGGGGKSGAVVGGDTVDFSDFSRPTQVGGSDALDGYSLPLLFGDFRHHEPQVAGNNALDGVSLPALFGETPAKSGNWFTNMSTAGQVGLIAGTGVAAAGIAAAAGTGLYFLGRSQGWWRKKKR